jgi:uncharacterized protein
MAALLDSSFLVALVNSKDVNHKRVAQVVQTIAEPLVLPLPVLSEVCYLVASRLGHHAMRRFVRELAHNDVVLEAVTRVDLLRTVEILEQYADSELDFADATTVAIAERKGIIRLLTLDRRDFTLVRPKHHPYFEILP